MVLFLNYLRNLEWRVGVCISPTQVQKLTAMMASATLSFSRVCFSQHHSTIPRPKSSRAFSNPNPFRCDFIAGNNAISLRSKPTKAASNPRRRFSCTSNLAEYAQTTSAVYGFLLLSGGFFAYTRTGSKGSLIGGLSGAAVMATAYYLMQKPETEALGDALGFGSAFLFASVFGIRLAATRKFAPAGPLLALSLSALAVFITAYLQDSVTNL